MSEATGSAFAILDGVRVLDLSRIIAGPYAAQMLTDFGAEVIKVERPGIGDDARQYGRGIAGGRPVSPAFGALNAGKRSVCLDLRSEEDRAILFQLVDSADVLIQNFRPGLAEKLGIDAETLRTRNPKLVYCTVSGFGETGPLRMRTAVDAVGQAYGGLMGINGEDGRPPARVPVPIADLASGLNATIAILAALLRRAKTGRGATVGVSLLESVVGLMSHHITETLITKVPMRRMGSRTRVGVPNQAFQTSDGWVMLSATNDSMWRVCAGALGNAALADDPRFRTQAARAEHEDECADEVEKLTSALSTTEVLERLEVVNVPCAPLLTIEELMRDPQIEALGLMTTEDYMGVTVPVVAGHFRLDGERSRPGRVPELGEHTGEVLARLEPDRGVVRS
ncbi:CoA transferase [Amycolatopsis sp. K13G38]|uniref:CoA transferase n=1 Tax=Amycolatopsis acididurans TaxID=2724524 RepID=A0ABX1JBW0_9PSEU|nr:CoA transferase [Amycolatopsis acididurans]NKQ56090.1 CoA transferase [Amycolatopsis acididurans]